MRKSDFDFSVPRRQSYVAILIISYRLYKVIARQLWPFLLIFLFKGSFSESSTFIFSIIGIALAGAIYSSIAFFKYYFYINNETLVINKGVFQKSVLEIPFDRIQSINFEQNLIHRVFNVVKLNMDTAGSSGSELQLNALDQTLATAITEHILSNQKSVIQNAEETRSEGSIAVVDNKEVIFRLDIPQLLKVGMSENHLRSGGFILLFFLWIWDNLRDAGVVEKEQMEDYIPSPEVISQSITLMAILAVVFFIVAFIISLVRSVLKYYDLHMYRIGEGFIIESGLFSRKEKAAKDVKIQVLRWSQNLLQRLSGIYDLSMRQASSVATARKQAIQVAGLDKQDIEMTQRFLFKEDYNNLVNINFKGVSSYFLYKRLFRWTFIFVPLIILTFYIAKYKYFYGFVLIYLLSILRSVLKYSKKKYGIYGNVIAVSGGVFGENAAYSLTHKVQNISIRSTPFQERRKLSTLIIFTASGLHQIPDIATQEALEIKNRLLYHVERSSEEWM